MLILKDMERDCLPQRHREHREETAGKNDGVIPTPRVFAYEWRTKDLRDRECVRVAGKGPTERHFCASVQRTVS